MSAQQLWYVRRGGKLLGPHPRQVVIDALLLGRLDGDDPGRIDDQAWQPLKSFPEIQAALYPPPRELARDPGEPPPLPWSQERLAAARRWADERSGIDRRGTEDEAVARDRRRGNDRRQRRELLQMVLWRRLRRDLAAGADADAVSGGGWVLLALVLAIAVAIVVWPRARGTIELPVPTRLAECNAPAAAAVNWAGCDKTLAVLPSAHLRGARLAGGRFIGADLRGADLAYADLAGTRLVEAQLIDARLFGATLTGADLRLAVLEGADLSFADLRNARMDDARLARARLGNAIWIDGRRCAPASVGRCD